MSRGKKNKKTFAEMSVKDVERLAKKALKKSGLTIKNDNIYSSERDVPVNDSDADRIFREMSRRPFE